MTARNPNIAASATSPGTSAINEQPGEASAAIADKLAEARKLIERGWCQFYYAVGKSGRAVSEHGSAAIGFSALGAIYRVLGRDYEYDDFQAVAGPLQKAAQRGSLSYWNDAPSRTQAEVIDAFKRAEQIARGEVA